LLQGGTYYSRYQERRTAELQANLDVAKAVATTFEEYVQDVLHQQLAIGLAFTSPQPFSPEQGNQYLAINAQEYPTVRGFAWLSQQGRVLASSDPQSLGLDVGDRPYFREIAAGREWDVSDLYLENVTGEPSFIIARGIRDARGALQGLVTTTVDAPHLGRVFAFERAGQGAFVIVDSQGRLVYPDPEATLSWEQRNLIADPLVRLALAGQEVTGTFNSSVDGQARMGALTPIRSIGWAAMAGRPEVEVNAQIFYDLARDSGLFLLVTVGALVGALFVSRNITVPVSRVRQYAASVGSGRDAAPLEITGPREMEELSAALGRMAEQIQVREGLLKAEVAELDSVNLALRDAQQRLMVEREEERKTLARELHDEIIQDLVSTHYQLDSITTDLGHRSEELNVVHEDIRSLIDAVRRICTDLRPPTIDSLGLGPAIQSYLHDWSARSGIATQFDLDPSLGRLPEMVELSIFRIVQEGLNNIRTHACAHTVWICLKHSSPQSVLLSIADDGRGMAGDRDLKSLAAQGHYGLLGISERVALLGGRMQVQNRPGGGVLLEVEIRHP
jgi:signal transduction histidine kinase